MEIKRIKENEKVTLEISGRLDTTTAGQLESEVSPYLNGIKELVLDFQELQYISSAGLRVLLSLQKVMNAQGSMVVKNVNEEVKSVFEITGFNDILTII